MANLRAWSDAANNLFAPGCEAQSMVVLATFGAPLLGYFPDPIGCVVSISGGRKRGKSTALAAADTAWGDAPDAPVVHSSLGNRDPNIAYNWLADLVNVGTMVISASAVALSAMLTLGIEFEVKVAGPLKNTDKPSLEQRMRANEGLASQKFMAYLAQPEVQEWVRYELASKVALIRKETDIVNVHQYRALAVCWVAGMMCAKLEILEVDPERVVRWAMQQLTEKK